MQFPLYLTILISIVFIGFQSDGFADFPLYKFEGSAPHRARAELLFFHLFIVILSADADTIHIKQTHMCQTDDLFSAILGGWIIFPRKATVGWVEQSENPTKGIQPYPAFEFLFLVFIPSQNITFS